MIMLDTSALIRLVGYPEKLSKAARKLIEETKKREPIIVSSISIWEIALLIKKGRLDIFIDPDKWLDQVESLSFLRFIPVDNWVAYKSVILNNGFHQDPADRIIVATALQYGATIITSDKKILDYKYVQSVW